MRTKSFLTILVIIFLNPGVMLAVPQDGSSQNPNLEGSVLKNYYSLLKKGDDFARKGENEKALACYNRALSLARTEDGEVIARGSLERFYEQTGSYNLALKETEWFLKRKLTSSGREKSEANKNRLLKKIEVQKKDEKIKDVKQTAGTRVVPPIRKITDFRKADYGSQKRFLEKELPEDTDILRLSKQAMLEEHSGKFAEAKRDYEQLLAAKDGTIAAHGEVGWVMLHAAVQRTAEVTGDEAKEEEMLLWIRDNMLAKNGLYHKYLNGLLPPVQDHLKQRLAFYKIEKE